MKITENASGFLFVGDPHVSSRKPGRRKDASYSETILNKLAEAVRIANDRNFVVVILGDLFDQPRETSEALRTRLTRILRGAKFQVVTIVGNHERHHARLSDDDTLANFEASGVLDVISDAGSYGVFDFDGKRVGLGGTPHGQELPVDVSGEFENVDSIVWITHHDLEFEGAYPKSIPTHEIEGCTLVVNGHMHLTKKIKKEGQTTWFNPGAITRQALDAMEHIPRVWALDASGRIEPIELTYVKDIFDLTGRLVDSIERDESEEEALESAFVQLIQVEESQDFAETDDGMVIREQIEAKFDNEDTDKRVRSAVTGLLNSVLETTEPA